VLEPGLGEVAKTSAYVGSKHLVVCIRVGGAATDEDLSELRRLLCPVESAPVDHGPGDGPPQWLGAGDWRLIARPRRGAPQGFQIERFALPNGEYVAAVFDDAERHVWVPFDIEEALLNYVSEAWCRYVPRGALSPWELSVYYRLKPLIPRRAQIWGRRLIARRKLNLSFPRWPIEDGVLSLLQFYGFCLLLALGKGSTTFRWFWPRGYRAALILTHDVESSAGLERALELADIEQERGFRSSFNIVASQYPIDHGVVRELKDRGFEIGVHGLRHDRSLFASHEAFVRQLPAVEEAARRLGAQGFRSPSTHRVYEWLAELPVLYDSSVPHSDPFEPQPGGCCTLWPYAIGGVIELPYTMSQDHTLFTLLERRSAEPWLRQVEAIEERHGLIQCLSHPDPGYLGDADKRALYVELLDALAERTDLWRSLPRDVAQWWRVRPVAHPADPDLTYGSITRAEHHAVLEMPSPRRADEAGHTT
jgi:peptidoglycan/xylan/chitin deacetylase (PgdA/CDA1 family)